MLTLTPFQPKEPKPYTDRHVVYWDSSWVGMVAKLESSWIVSLSPDDPKFDTQKEAIDYLVQRRFPND